MFVRRKVPPAVGRSSAAARLSVVVAREVVAREVVAREVVALVAVAAVRVEPLVVKVAAARPRKTLLQAQTPLFTCTKESQCRSFKKKGTRVSSGCWCVRHLHIY